MDAGQWIACVLGISVFFLIRRILIWIVDINNPIIDFLLTLITGAIVVNEVKKIINRVSKK